MMLRLFSFFILIPTLVAGQDHLPFRYGTKKVFVAENGLGRAYSLALDSFQVNGVDTTFFNYFELDSVESGGDLCVGWGGPNCIKQDIPSWAGRSLQRINSTGIVFLNIFGDTIQLDLDQALTDTSLFYEDGLQRFSVILDQADTATILGVQDSIRQFTIIHQDNFGATINSDLNGASISIGKMLGIVNFFQIDSFPQILRPLKLLGDANWEIGLWRITPAVVHDYQPGDIIQIHSTGSNYPPPITYDSYIRYEILERTETSDHVNYVAERQQMFVTTGVTTDAIVQLSYSRTDLIAHIPFESFSGVDQELNVIEECGLLVYEYFHFPSPYIGFCPADTCWVGIDTNGPQPSDIHHYRLGIWPERSMYSTAAFPYFISDNVDVVYYMKNGIPCGNEVIMGIRENVSVEERTFCFPNPTSTSFTVIDELNAIGVQLIDIHGKVVLSQNNGMNEIFIGHLNEGIYLVKIGTTEGWILIDRLLIQR